MSCPVPEVMPVPEAVTLTRVSLVTTELVAVNCAVVEPAAMVTLAGTLSAALLLLRVTTVFALGALARVTVPVMLLPPETPAAPKLTDAWMEEGAR